MENRIMGSATTLLSLAALLPTGLGAQAKDLAKVKVTDSVIVLRVLGMKKAKSGAT